MKVVPHLSSKGWVKPVVEKFDLLLSYFFLSEKSQTALYTGNVASLPAIIQETGHNESAVKEMMAEVLRKYLSNYFDNVTVTVETKPVIDDGTERTNVIVSALLDERGVTYDLAKSIVTHRGELHKVINLTNGVIVR